MNVSFSDGSRRHPARIICRRPFPRLSLRVWTGVLLLISSALIALNYRSLLLRLGNFLIIEDQLVRADVIAVVSGPDYRTDYAIQLYKGRYGGLIFFTGGWCPVIQGNHAERGKSRALAQGVPITEIAEDGNEVTSTYAEALRLKAFIDANGTPVLSVIVVSDPFHMRRARWAYRQVLGEDVKVQMAPVPFESLPYPRQWWRNSESRRMVTLEYAKFVYYLARYKYSSGRIQDWLASMDQE